MIWGYIGRHWRRLALVLLGVLLPFLLVMDLAEDVFKDGGFAWDNAILEWYAAHRTPLLTELAFVLATLGGVPFLPLFTVVLALVMLRFGSRAHVLFLLLSVGGATLLNLIAKLFFQRPRPGGVSVLLEPGYSFPSGHAMANAAFGLALAFIFWRTRGGKWVALGGVAWAVLVAVSRNYLGVHYPTDVLVGFLTSTAWVTGLYLTMSRPLPELLKGPFEHFQQKAPARA